MHTHTIINTHTTHTHTHTHTYKQPYTYARNKHIHREGDLGEGREKRLQTVGMKKNRTYVTCTEKAATAHAKVTPESDSHKRVEAVT